MSTTAITDTPPTSASASPDPRSAIVALDQAGETYRCVDLACRHLAREDRDPQIVAVLLKHLLKLGLGGPAREIVDQRADLEAPDLDIDLPALRKAVAGTPTGRVPWSATEPTFNANFELIMQRWPRLAAHARAISDSLRNLQLWRAADGHLHLSRRLVGRMREWIPALSDYADLLKLEIARGDLSRATLIIGLGPHTLVESIALATGNTKSNGTVPLFVVEPEWERLAAWLHGGDRRPILADPRLALFAGPESVSEFERHLLASDNLEAPTLRFTCHAPPQLIRELDDAVARVTASRNERFAALVKIHDQRCRQRSGPDWAARLRPGARILGITSRFTTMLQHSTRDIGMALESLGYRFTRIMEADDHLQHNSLTVRSAVHEIDPALIILTNHLRYEHAKSYGDVPILTWIQDPMDNLLCREAGRSIGPRDFVCGYYRTQCISDYAYPARQFLDHWVFPISGQIFHDRTLSPQDQAEHGCDIMYVGHYNGTPQTVLQSALAQHPPSLHALINRVWERMIHAHAASEHPDHAQPRDLIRQAAAELDVPVPEDRIERLAQFLVLRTFDIAFRHQTLEWVGRWAARTGRRFRIYGKGWDSHPTLARWAAGPVEHGDELRRACRAATLNLQTIHTGFWHQRSFEALASGSLVLARFSPWDHAGLRADEFDRLRAAGEPLAGTIDTFPQLPQILFDSERQFGARADFFLTDPAARRRMTDEFRAVVLNTFTYEAVMPRLIDEVRAGLVRVGAC